MKNYEEQVFKGKNLKEVSIEHHNFVDCHFDDCYFEACRIISCSFTNCRFTNCDIISLSSEHSEVKGAVFQKCNLIGVHWEKLSPANKYLHSIDKFSHCYLKYNFFVDMNLKSFDFSTNVIQESIFEKCNLSESNFNDCNLESTQFVGCDIRKSDFREARGYSIDISTNKLKAARFSFPEVVRLLDSLEIKID